MNLNNETVKKYLVCTLLFFDLNANILLSVIFT